MLTNRKTGEKFLAAKDAVTGKIVKQRFFAIADAKKSASSQYDLTEFFTDFESRLPADLSKAERAAIMSEVRTCCAENEIELIDTINKRDQLFASDQKKLPSSVKTSHFDEGSLLKSVGGLLFSSAFPTAALALAFMPLAAAQTSLVVHSGQPSGSKLDLCSPYVLGCIQGYLTNGTAPWDTSMSQFDRVVQEVNSQDAEVGAYQQLKECMSNNKVGKMVATAVDNGVGAPGYCAYSSSTWQGYQVLGQATQVPVDQCPTLQSTFAAESQQCMSILGQAKQTGIIAGVTVATVCIALAAYFFVKERCCKKPSENQDLENQNPPRRAILL